MQLVVVREEVAEDRVRRSSPEEDEKEKKLSLY